MDVDTIYMVHAFGMYFYFTLLKSVKIAHVDRRLVPQFVRQGAKLKRVRY